jgi:hypothetical protein
MRYEDRNEPFIRPPFDPKPLLWLALLGLPFILVLTLCATLKGY